MSKNPNNSKEDKRKVLFICAHPDDDILVGGTIRKLVDVGWEAYEIVCSTSKYAFRKNGEGKDIEKNRTSETKKYCKLLGINNPVYLTSNGRLFNEDEGLIMKVTALLREIRPDVIILLNKDDYHFEHKVAHDIGLRAFELASRKTHPELGSNLSSGVILQTDGLNVLSNPFMTFDTSDTHTDKMNAIETAYMSRISEKLRNFTDGLATMRGARYGYKYGESYDLLNPTWYKFVPENAVILSEFISAGSLPDQIPAYALGSPRDISLQTKS